MQYRRAIGALAVLLGWVLSACANAPADVTRTPDSQLTLPAEPTVHLTAAGDYRSTEFTAAVVQGIGKANPDANLMLGDLSYGQRGKEAEWCTWVTERMGSVPQVIVSGNHEANGRNGNINAFIECLKPPPSEPRGTYGRQFYVDFPESAPLVRVIMISPGLDFGNGEEDYSEGTQNYIWTEQAIKQARHDGIQWTIVVYHRPCLSMGIYGCGSGRDLQRLILREKVDLVLSGHEHLYQRTNQLTEGVRGCTKLPTGETDSDCIVARGSDFVAGKGTVFATVGTGGTPLRSVHPDDHEAGYFAASSGRNSQPTYGFLDLTVTPSSLKAHFDGAGTGPFTDSFSIVRD